MEDDGSSWGDLLQRYILLAHLSSNTAGKHGYLFVEVFPHHFALALWPLGDIGQGWNRTKTSERVLVPRGFLLASRSLLLLQVRPEALVGSVSVHASSLQVYGLHSKLLIGPEQLTGLPNDPLKQMWAVPIEERVEELHELFVLQSYFLEVVHVQLAVERLEFLVLKVFGQQHVFESFLVQDPETLSLFSPANDMVGFVVLDHQEESLDELGQGCHVKFGDEGLSLIDLSVCFYLHLFKIKL
jgi:hypothetical protein